MQRWSRSFVEARAGLQQKGGPIAAAAAATGAAGHHHSLKVLTYNILANKYALGG